MYNSPIEMIVSDMYTQMMRDQENQIYKAVQNVGINADRDELVKALQYDRGMYDKGYRDGWQAAKEEIVRCKDCKHYGYDPYDNGDKCCVLWGEWIFPEDDDFCSRGERKEQ